MNGIMWNPARLSAIDRYLKASFLSLKVTKMKQ